MTSRVFELITLILFIILSVISLMAIEDIKGISFDPLGSKSIPYGISILTLLLSIICLLKMFKQKHNTVNKSSAEQSQFSKILIVLTITVSYVYIIFELRIPFSMTTMVAIPILTKVISESYSKRLFILSIISAFIVGYGGETLLTKFFLVDIPKL